MEIDFRSVWSWTLPLWALVVIVAFLGGVLTQPVRVLPESMRRVVSTTAAIAATAAAPPTGMPSLPRNK
jgi:hypothetical protein